MNAAAIRPFVQRVILATVAIASMVGLMYLAWLARVPLGWIAVAAFLAVAVNPVILRLQHHVPRKSLAASTLIVLVVLCVAGGVLAWLFLSPLLEQAARLGQAIPALASKASEYLGDMSLAEFLKSETSPINVSQLTSIIASTAGRLVEFIIAVVSIISLMFFMTMEGKKMKKLTLDFFGKSQRERLQRLGSSVYGIISGYVVGNLAISGIYGLASGLVLWATGSPYFLILGLAAALIDLIPLVGATIAAILIAIVCLLNGQAWAAIIFIIFTIVYVQFESAVLNPAIYSNTVDVSPLTVLVAILIGGVVAGVVGALIAIPVAATIKVVIREVCASRLPASGS